MRGTGEKPEIALSDRISSERLAVAVGAALGVDPGGLAFTHCPTGKYNSTWFVEGYSEPLAVRVAPPDRREMNLFYEHRMMRQEPELHRAILERTSMPVPRILHADFSHERMERDFLIMERNPGRPVSDYQGLRRNEWDRALGELGEKLRQVHALHADYYGYTGEHRPMTPRTDWTSAFVAMWNSLLDDIEFCGGYGKREADALRSLLDSRLDCFTRTGPACLLHMDIWAQNILLLPGGRLACLIDWDRSLRGDPEIEFAVLDYCGIPEPAFWEGYGEKRTNDREARVRQGFYLLYELQKYIFIRRVRGGNPALADNYRLQSLELAAGLGLRF